MHAQGQHRVAPGVRFEDHWMGCFTAWLGRNKRPTYRCPASCVEAGQLATAKRFSRQPD